MISVVTTIALTTSLLPAFGKNPTAAAEGLDDNIHWNELKHDTRDPLFRHPFGAVPAGEAVRLRMQTKAGDVESVKLILWDDLKKKQSVHPMTPVGISPDGLLEYWETTVSSDRPTVFWYHFELQDGSRIVRYADQPEQDGGIGEPTDGHPLSADGLRPGFPDPRLVQAGNHLSDFPGPLLRRRSLQQPRRRRPGQPGGCAHRT